MEIIAFETTPEKGIIKIPEKYLKSIAPHLRVIVVLTEQKQEQKAKPEFNAFRIDGRDVEFDREEANARR